MSMYYVFFSTETEDRLLKLAILLNRTPDDLLTDCVEESMLKAALHYKIEEIGDSGNANHLQHD